MAIDDDPFIDSAMTHLLLMHLFTLSVLSITPYLLLVTRNFAFLCLTDPGGDSARMRTVNIIGPCFIISGVLIRLLAVCEHSVLLSALQSRRLFPKKRSSAGDLPTSWWWRGSLRGLQPFPLRSLSARIRVLSSMSDASRWSSIETRECECGWVFFFLLVRDSKQAFRFHVSCMQVTRRHSKFPSTNLHPVSSP